MQPDMMSVDVGWCMIRGYVGVCGAVHSCLLHGRGWREGGGGVCVHAYTYVCVHRPDTHSNYKKFFFSSSTDFSFLFFLQEFPVPLFFWGGGKGCV